MKAVASHWRGLVRCKGFSLIELLIVVAIIMVMVAIAIPSLLRSRISANEASAVSALRTINTAQTTYAVTYPLHGYADSLTKLRFPPPGNQVSENEAGLLDWVLGCAAQPCTKAGYKFQITNLNGVPIVAYDVTAVPVSQGNTGVRGFCSNQVPRIAYDPAGATNCTVPVQ
jgi:type IV pilus assembly protein PilA